MVISTSQLGIDINYYCRKLPDRGRKCPDKNTNKCYKCEYCVAEMPAKYATKLINSYRQSIIDKYK